MDSLNIKTLILPQRLCKKTFLPRIYAIFDEIFIHRLASPDQRDAFGIIVSYAVKVKLFLGALGGELAAELPFVLMHPKPGAKPKLIKADSQADVETFRQDTIDPEPEE